MDHVFTPDQKRKLTQIVNEGMNVMQEVEDLNAGLNETIKAIAEEMNVKPSVLKKAIRIAFKASFTDAREDFDTLETILETVGRTI